MICERCGKNREKTFRRVGGMVPAVGREGDKEIKGFTAVCLPCVKRRMRNNPTQYRGPIITNPTVKPSGDPLEWVINE